MSAICTKRTFRLTELTSAFDPKRTFTEKIALPLNTGSGECHFANHREPLSRLPRMCAALCKLGWLIGQTAHLAPYCEST
jgi:hypothetical protein